MTNGVQTPELDKLRKISHYSQKIGEFLEWLKRAGFVIAVRHYHTNDCRPSRPTAFGECGMRDGDLFEAAYSTRTLLGRFFKLDLDKIESEKRALLEVIKKGHAP
jgi:hypothetical protein